MKFKKFAALTKKVGRCEIINLQKENLQFLNNGYVYYPMHDLQPIDNETLYALIDVEKEKRDNFSITHITEEVLINVSDTDSTEEPLLRARLIIKFQESSDIVQPVFTKYGLFYYCPNWLAPFDGESYELFLRYCSDNRGGFPYIAVKTGMFVLGFVALQNLNTHMNMFAGNGKEDLQTLCSMIEVTK